MNITNEVTKGPFFTNRLHVLPHLKDKPEGLSELWGLLLQLLILPVGGLYALSKSNTLKFPYYLKKHKWQRLGKWGFTLKFSLEFLYTVDRAHLINHGLSRKGPMPGVGHLPSSCSPEVSWRPQGQYRLLALLSFAHQNLTVKLYCWRHGTDAAQDMEESSWYWPG